MNLWRGITLAWCNRRDLTMAIKGVGEFAKCPSSCGDVKDMISWIRHHQCAHDLRSPHEILLKLAPDPRAKRLISKQLNIIAAQKLVEDAIA